MRPPLAIPARRATRATRALVTGAAAALVAGCAPPLTGCTLAADAVTLPAAVRETSGAAWSRIRPGRWWTLNDGGNGPELLALDTAGTLEGRVRVTGAVNRDWEDLAAGPCAGGAGDCLYVADIGDNGATADHIVLYRVPEPMPGDTTSAPAERFVARYPAGARDAEALVVLPDGSAYVLTKGRRTPIELYRVPLDRAGAHAPGLPARGGAAQGTPVLQPVRVLAPTPDDGRDRVTGAGATPDGRWIAVRTGRELAIWGREALLGGGAPTVRTSVRALGEPQGEAVALAAGGRVLLTSESDGDRPTMHRLACRLP